MISDDILRMAREASGGTVWWPINSDALERFAALVAAAEREACAKVAEDHQHDCYYGDLDWHEARRITAAIRARGEE